MGWGETTPSLCAWGEEVHCSMGYWCRGQYGIRKLAEKEQTGHQDMLILGGDTLHLGAVNNTNVDVKGVAILN